MTDRAEQSTDEGAVDGQPATGATKVARPPLSKVMLAMDVVDTLRHHRAIVESELNEEARERALIERVKAIYGSQGIDVPDEVIREGVEALARDRFTYKPPERTLAVRLAEIYVRRGFYTKILLALLAIGGAIWGSFAFANHKRDQALIQGFDARLGDHQQETAGIDVRIAAAERELATVDSDRPVIRDIAQQAQSRLAQVRSALASWKQGTPPLVSKAYPDARDEMDQLLEARREFVGSLGRDVGRVEASLQVVSMLRESGSELGSAMSLLQGVTISEQDQARIDAMQKLADAAIDSGDPELAKQRVAQLTSLVRSLRVAEAAKRDIEAQLAAADVRITSLPTLERDVVNELAELHERVTANLKAGRINEAKDQVDQLRWMVGVLDQAYEMRIISRHGERSGIWRYPVGRPNVRNYYIQVEAIGKDGRALTLEFKNEETQRMVKTNRIAIRVPKSVYEAIKKDKLDNGLIDDNLFAVKKRGERSPDYKFDVDGGWITGER